MHNYVQSTNAFMYAHMQCTVGRMHLAANGEVDSSHEIRPRARLRVY